MTLFNAPKHTHTPHNQQVNTMSNTTANTRAAYKLFNQRKDGSLGPLFIGRRQRLEPGQWYAARDLPTKGYAHRPGWHSCQSPDHAPHLKQGEGSGRVWAKVEIRVVEEHDRPASQGGKWYLSEAMKIVEVLV